MLSNFLILVAGGRGLRMGSDLPKQFMPLAGEPVIMRTIRRFVEAMPGIGIVVVLHPDYVDMWHRLCEEHGFDISVRIVRGGEERFYSVKNGLDAISSSAGDDILRVIPLSENRYQISLSSRSDGKDKMVCIKVYDVKNLQTKIHDNFEKEDYIFETFSWKRGFYIIEITMGKKKYTTKLSVR